MTPHKLKMIMKAFVLSQFNYCPLVWMFHSRELNNRINRIHERALQIAYKDHRNIQTLANEIYKVLHDLSPKIMVKVFRLKDTSYNFRTDALFSSGNFRTVNYGLQYMNYLAPKIWNLVPENIKESPSLKSFKRGIKQWVPYVCPCRLFRQYVPDLGFK